jgi:hypothetical protein
MRRDIERYVQEYRICQREAGTKKKGLKEEIERLEET